MRVALIAMSGIRACDRELQELGLTLPGFVERGHAIASLPSLGLLTLAGQLRREGRLLDPHAWERCTLFDVNHRPQLMTADELREGFRHLAERLYASELTQWRRENFKEFSAAPAYRRR